MDKYEKQIAECYERMKHTLRRCAEVPEMGTDTELLMLVYEELTIDVRCDLCDENLGILLEQNYIYPEIVRRIVWLRENAAVLAGEPMAAALIRDAKEWRMVAEEAKGLLEMLYI